MSRPESLLEYQRLVLEAHRLLNQLLLKTGVYWCSTLYLTEKAIWEVYCKYTLSILHLYLGHLKFNRSML